MNGARHHRSEQRVAVWDIDDPFVLRDLRDEAPGMQIVGYRHAQPQGQNVWEYLHQVFHPALRVRIEAVLEVRPVLFRECQSANQVVLVIMVDATRCENRDMNSSKEAAVGEIERANCIAAYGFFLVAFAPVNIRATSHASAVENVCWLDFVEYAEDGFAVFHAAGCCPDRYTLGFEVFLEQAGDPAICAPYQRYEWLTRGISSRSRLDRKTRHGGVGDKMIRLIVTR